MKKYEIHVPIKETWVFVIEATSKSEALSEYYQDKDIEQVYSYSGWPPGNRDQETSIVQVRQIKKEEK